jgi:hypothetical protein
MGKHAKHRRCSALVSIVDGCLTHAFDLRLSRLCSRFRPLPARVMSELKADTVLIRVPGYDHVVASRQGALMYTCWLPKPVQ